MARRPTGLHWKTAWRIARLAIPMLALMATLPTFVLAWTGRWMSEAELRAAFGGATIEGHYVDGTRFREAYRTDRTLEYAEQSRRMSGHWSVAGGSFCTIYTQSPTGGCYRVAQISVNCFEFHFVASTEADAKNAPRRGVWTARGWRIDLPPGCPDTPIG